MKKIIFILLLFPTLCFSQNFIGIKADIMNYKLKSFRDPGLSNTGASYSVFTEIHFKKLLNFGVEIGGYKFELDKNTSTNLFIKPTLIFNAQLGKNNFSVSPGISFDVSVSNKINNPYKDYYTYRTEDTIVYSEPAYFQKSFASILIGVAYSRQITKKFDVGIKIETMGTLDGFYKGYNFGFTRYGLFLKYKI